MAAADAADAFRKHKDKMSVFMWSRQDIGWVPGWKPAEAGAAAGAAAGAVEAGAAEVAEEGE